MSDARETILRSIRAQLEGVRPAPPPDRTLPVGRPRIGDDQLLQTFVRELEALGASVARVADEAAAARHLDELGREQGWRELALSDAPLVQRIAARTSLATCDAGSVERARLFACAAGLSAVQGAVAETGTLVLLAAEECHRLVSLVPPLHVALVQEAQVAATLDAALELARAADLGGHLLTLISGPSRTADIELTLVVGVHGPRQLHVVLIEDPRAGT